MRGGMYWRYSLRSLVRGRQRSLLAIFCIAVGVMAIVALQLVGISINRALTGNITDVNGGDVNVYAPFTPLLPDDLAYFERLKQSGLISDYASANGSIATINQPSGESVSFELLAVSRNFPIAGQPDFLFPSRHMRVQEMVQGQQVILAAPVFQQLHAHLGETFQVRSRGDGRIIPVTIVAVFQDGGGFRGTQMVISRDTLDAIPRPDGQPVSQTRSTAFFTVPATHLEPVKKILTERYPVAQVTTAQDTLALRQNDVTTIRLFLRIVGLLALFIGGIGILHTMHVFLRRRSSEIATLKTVGYRARDLYLLFGLEVGLLGAAGGIIGIGAGIGISVLVRAVVEQAFFLHLTVILDPQTLLSGILIGIAAAEVFGLLPIIQASQIRPVSILREDEETVRRSSLPLRIGLLLLLSFLFTGLAATILESFPLALAAVYGGTSLIALLAIGFSLLIMTIARLPIYERPDRRMMKWILLALGFVGSMAGMNAILFVLGILLARSNTTTSTPYITAYTLILLLGLGLVVLGGGVVFLITTLGDAAILFTPRSWKASVLFAYRNLGRQRARSTTTLTTLFVGVFAIGLVLITGQNLQENVNQFASTQVYNLFLAQPAHITSAVQVDVSKQLGIDSHRMVVNPAAQMRLVRIKGQPVEKVFAGIHDISFGNGTTIGTNTIQTLLRAIKGYPLGSGRPQDIPDVTLQAGKNLSTTDAGSNRILVAANLQLPPLSLHIGDTLLVQSVDRTVTRTLTIKGFYTVNPVKDFPLIGLVIADDLVARAIGGSITTDYLALHVETKQLAALKEHISRTQPLVQVISFADALGIVNQIFTNVVLMLITISSLTLLAGLIIIGNAVALAMVERRREIGILKSVGHTSLSILSTVMLENGLIGVLSSLVAMVLVSGTMVAFRLIVLKTDPGFSPLLAGLIVVVTTLVTTLIAVSVAWNAVRVRPLDVLRYE